MKRCVKALLLVPFSLILVAQPGRPTPHLVIQAGHYDGVVQIAFSPDDSLAITGSADNRVKLWNLASGREVRTFEHENLISGLSFLADGRHFLASASNSVYLWDSFTGKLLKEYIAGEEVEAFTLSADHHTVVTAGYSGSLAFLNFETGEFIRRIALKAEPPTVLFRTASFSKDSRLLASSDENDNIHVWDSTTGAELSHFAAPKGRIDTLAFSPDASRLASAGATSVVTLSDVSDGKELWSFKGHTDAVSSLAFTPDARSLISGGKDKSICVLDVGTGTLVRTILGHQAEIESLAVSADSAQLLSGSSHGGTIYWNLTTGERLQTLIGKVLGVANVAMAPDGRTAFSVSSDGNINRWDLKNSTHTQVSVNPFDSGATFSADGRFLVTATRESPMELWDVATGRKVRTFDEKSAGAASLAISRDARFVICAAANAYMDDDVAPIQLWDTSTGRLVREFGGRLTGFSRIILAFAFSPDGRYAVSGSQDRTATLWDLSTGRQIRRFAGHFRWVEAVDFSPNNQYVATGGLDGKVMVWDVATGARIHLFESHTSGVLTVKFSPDGRYIISGSGDGGMIASADNTARLWDMQTGKEVTIFSGHQAKIYDAAFSNDGRLAVTGSSDGTAILWRTGIGGVGQPSRAAAKPASSNPLCSLASFADGTWAMFDAEGRFDTNNLEDIQGLHWIAPDDPLRPLPLEIFMRDYYQPGLVSRILAGETFLPVPNLLDLNRVQPVVRIARIALANTGSVSVTVEVSEAKKEFLRSAQKVVERSGAYDLRLFRNNQLVGYAPLTEGGGAPGKLELDNSGRATIVFSDVLLPHDPALSPVTFTAYAFNSDRVKSVTARSAFTPQAASPSARGRAYVISFGVNISENPAWRLQYAANDARLAQSVLTQKLKDTAEYQEVIPIPLISEDVREGERAREVRTASKENLRAVLAVLAGKQPGKDLSKLVPDAGRLRKVTPDDLVILTIASHGHADSQGVFYLFPQDSGANYQDGLAGVLPHAISSNDLMLWLRDVDAGELVLVLDACYSAATVEPGFKPGPLGSRGLGQLSYDKGMRILAATQADNVALESANLEHGLLTAALIQDGLARMLADTDPKDGTITIGKLLRYAVRRVPQLYQEAARGRREIVVHGQTARAAGTRDSAMKILRTEPQVPVLFDFVRRRKDAVLAKSNP